MDECRIDYIPSRLHTGSRDVLPQFEIGEILYRRCSRKIIDNPFDISLVDISVNRRGPQTSDCLSEPTDVLFNFTPEKREGTTIDELAIALVIKRLSQDMTYKFVARPEQVQLDPSLPIRPNQLTQEEIDNTVCTMDLVHRPEPCNYAHSAFEIKLDGVEATYQNWATGLNQKKYRELRTKLRQELADMVLKEEVWSISI